ncbi:hypothetical protein [Occultella gossypii]|uniref:Uncharacterized protein n=1 Tax=Occultella gossypii TaxID=2800820 RepID=A0ABS7SDW7_9MICO|nr:hypothetical protein [Occultella gossypii]MBZ2198442.1 hypothetical protein [Occultella gossypii]
MSPRSARDANPPENEGGDAGRAAKPGRDATIGAKAAMPAWLRWPTIVLAAVAVLVVLYLIGSAVLPLWWAQLIGDQVDSVSSAGILLGLVVGFAFTAVPIALGVWAIRAKYAVRTRLIIGGIAVLLTAPNVLTLAVAVGGLESTQAARIEMLIAAEQFPIWSLVGVIVAVLLAVAIWYLVWNSRRRKRELEELRGKVASGQISKTGPDEDAVANEPAARKQKGSRKQQPGADAEAERDPAAAGTLGAGTAGRLDAAASPSFDDGSAGAASAPEQAAAAPPSEQDPAAPADEDPTATRDTPRSASRARSLEWPVSLEEVDGLESDAPGEGGTAGRSGGGTDAGPGPAGTGTEPPR